MFDELQEKFVLKEKLLKKTCEENNLDVSISGGIEMQSGDHPEIVLSRKNLLFSAQFNAEVGFDMYIED